MYVIYCWYFASFFSGQNGQADEKMKCNNCDRKFNPFYDCWCRRGVWSEDKIESLRKKYNLYHWFWAYFMIQFVLYPLQPELYFSCKNILYYLLRLWISKNGNLIVSSDVQINRRVLPKFHYSSYGWTWIRI